MFPERHEATDPAAAADFVATLILDRAAAAIGARGRFVLALCGGNTPRPVYERLAVSGQDWQRWHLVHGDERCLPSGHAELNATLVEDAWLRRAAFPAENHHIAATDADVQRAAVTYAEEIAPLLPLDMALLGAGEDGHTASLFPGHSHPAGAVVPVRESPKPPPERISLSYDTLCDAATVCFLVTGSGKQDMLRRWEAGDPIPVSHIRGREQTLLVTG